LGLKSLHESQLFHGSLKPSDILLDSNFNVSLTDYLSYSFEHCHFTYSCLVSSPNYTAPECYQLEDEEFCIQKKECVEKLQKVDVFAVGLIIYEILTYQPVFSPDLSASDLRRKTGSRDRPSIPPSIKGGFGQLIDKCWDSDPSKRPMVGEIWRILNSMRYQIIDGVDPNVVESRITPPP
jgi:serine/threonine protein kinase